MSMTNVTPAATLKKPGEHNPLMTQRFGADPYALVYNGRTYIYMTADVIETNPDGSPPKNASSIQSTICLHSQEGVKTSAFSLVRCSGEKRSNRRVIIGLNWPSVLWSGLS